MPQPAAAIVRPRVISPTSGDVLLLEDEIRSLLARGKRGAVCLTGGPGSGKTTAIAHLAAVLPDSVPVNYYADVPSPIPPNELAVCSGDSLFVPSHAVASYRLATWGEDELIEYLLAVHHDQCASVMGRYRLASDRSFLRGIPELWRPVLDALAGDLNLPTIHAALNSALDRALGDGKLRDLAANWCLAILRGNAELGASYRASLAPLCDFATLLRLLRHPPVLLLLSAELIARKLRMDGPCEFLQSQLAHELIVETAEKIRDEPSAIERLEAILQSDSDWKSQPMAASLLHACQSNWRPSPKPSTRRVGWFRSDRFMVPSLHGAHLAGVHWPKIAFPVANLGNANLSGAELSEADLHDANLASANLSDANLQGANLDRVGADGASFSRADLSHVRAADVNFRDADLRGARLEGANLARASFFAATLAGAKFVRADLASSVFGGADITGTDFSQSNLEGAVLMGLDLRQAVFHQCRFARANLANCNLEGMSLPGVDLSHATLTGALFTDSFMPAAKFVGAKLANAGLAEIHWEHADLRDADLRGVSFHMGSSRSGLVDSPIASYGTRTGFYTDDYNEQDFKAVEEIRKANLRGADLRGANIDGVDFYLVDLREAHYDADQEAQLRGTGAILESRVT